MIGEQIVANVAGQAFEKGMKKLSPKTSAIITNSISAAFGIIVTIAALSKLYQALNADKDDDENIAVV